MLNPVIDRAVTDQLRDELDKAVIEGALGLIDNNTDRRAGRVQGLRDALSMLNSIIQRTNDQRSPQQVK